MHINIWRLATHSLTVKVLTKKAKKQATEKIQQLQLQLAQMVRDLNA